MSAGRPTKYDPAYCEQVITAGDAGLSLTAFAGRIRVARSTINKWMDEHAEFAEAVDIAKAVRTLYLEDQLLVGDPKRVTAHIFALKNAAPDEWRDRREVAHSGTISHEHALAELE